ncbi:MAG TPA: hypothetical protein VEX41_04530, partial [Candidatus Eisenbacteria bacterium]|nr:hypothetical protein [Candidatus Eisenbacteria bacterium]
AGLQVIFGEATATLDARGGSVELEATFKNPGPFSAALAAPILLTAGGDAYELQRGTELPEVPSAGTTEATLTFDVLGRTTVDDAVLRIGAPENHQALVPLRSGTVPLVTLEPVTAPATGSGVAGDVTVALHGAVLRWDLPDWNAELPLASEALTVTYDVTYTGTFAGGFPFTGANVALQLPDGTLVEPRRDGRSQSVEVVDPGATVLAATRFEIPAGTRGGFGLLINNDGVKATIAFTVDG